MAARCVIIRISDTEYFAERKRKTVQDFRNRFLRFMSGRYGTDEFNRFIFILIWIFILLKVFFGLGIFSKISLALAIIYSYRAFSKNYNQRYHENQIFLKHSEKIRWQFSQIKKTVEYRKTHKIFKCKKCGKKLSVPRGKGKIEVSCPCGNRIVKKS